MRSRPTTLATLSAVAVSLLALGACSSGEDAAPASSTGTIAATTVDEAAPPASWELVARAGGAWIGDSDPENLGSVRPLRLSQVDPDVVAFADRPVRRQGTMTVEEVLSLWHGGAFGQDPPNAAIATDLGTWAVELSAAVWDPEESALVLGVRPLDGIDGTPVDDIPTGDLGPVAVFVDPFVPSQITDAVTQTNVKVLGEPPAEAMGLTYQTLAHSVGLSMDQGQLPNTTSMYVPGAAGAGATPDEPSEPTIPPPPGFTPAEWAAFLGGL